MSSRSLKSRELATA